jgi:AcrR family transcriptional regulator
VTKSLLKAAPGRPRSESTHEAILQAANELLEENGFSGLTVEAIAASAGVAKTTIYRWWPNKGAVAMEAFLAATSPKIAFPETGSAINDVVTQMRTLIGVYNGVTGKIVSELIALGQSDPETLRNFVTGYLEPRRTAAKRILKDGMERGEIRGDVDPDILVDSLYGPIFHRMLSKHAPLTEEFAQGVADYVFRGTVGPKEGGGPASTGV